MERYKLGKALGDGGFGSVAKGINQKTGNIVAIKRMKKKYPTWEECQSQNEVKVLRKLHHPNIIGLYELIKHENQLYYIFEYMERNVYEMLLEEHPLPEETIRNILYQVFQALAYMHRHGYFHRDLKPENFLQMNGTVKLADFGLVREIRAKPPFTEYVSTRWYRAPEVLLHSRNYNSPMDMFAMGAIMAELYMGVPIYPGTNERDQLMKILSIMGTPSKDQWPDGYKMASSMGIELPKEEGKKLSGVVPRAPTQALDLMNMLMQVNPQRRPTASQVIQHEYFQVKPPREKPKMELDKHQHNYGSEESFFQNARYRPGTICKD